MKKLFKSTFKSMFSNKIVVILLAIVVFVTSSTFTLIQSTSAEFAKSYDHVVTQGNIHDFTIKEKFSTNGEIPIITEEDGPKSTIISADSTKENVWTTDQGKRYLLVPSTHSPVQVTGKSYTLYSGWTNQMIKKEDGTEAELSDLASPLGLDIRIPAENIKITETTSGGSTTQSLELIYKMHKDANGVEKEVLEVEVYSPRTDMSKWSGSDDMYTPLFYENAPISQMKQRDINSLWQKVLIPASIATADKGTLSLINKSPVTAGPFYQGDIQLADPNDGAYVLDSSDGYLWYKFTPRATMDEFKADLLTFINQGHLYKSVDVHRVRVHPDIDFDNPSTSNVTGDFYKYLKSLHTNNLVEYNRLYSKVLVNQIYSARKIATVVKPATQTTVTQLDGTVIVTDTDGTVTITRPDKTVEVRKPDGTIIVTKPDTTVIETAPNGDVTTTYPDKTQKVITAQPSNPEIDNLKRSLKQQVYLDIRQSALNKFNESIHTKYKDEVAFKHVRGISVSGTDDNKLYKFIENEPSTYVDKTVIFEGQNISQPNHDSIVKQANEWATANGAYVAHDPSGQPFIEDRGFKVVVHRQVNGMEATPRVFIDPTSVQVVVSPTFAKRNNIVPMSQATLDSQEFKDLMNNATEDNLAKFHAKYSHSTIQANSLTYVVTGIGITPDFAYPIIDSHHPIPDLDNEALLYVNSAGYARVEESFRDNLRESYFAGRFLPGVSEARKTEIKADLEVMAKSMMSWPSDIQIVRNYNDITEKVIMAPHRITFLEKLNNSIRTISIVITTLLIVLAALIVTLIIKRNISKQRKTLSILNANGYTKNQIAMSYIWSSSLVVGASITLGFIVGHLMQFVMFNIFSDFWTIPTAKHPFSIISLLATVIIPMLGVVFLSYVFSMWELRGSIVMNMAGAKKTVGHWVSAKSLSKLHWVGIKTKLATSFFLTNLSKAVMIFISAAGAIIASSMAFTMFGKFDHAVNATDRVNTYQYSIDMATPTVEGGQYTAVVQYDPRKPIIEDGEDLSKIQHSWGVTRPTRYWAGMENNKARGEIILSPTTTKGQISMFHSPSGNDLKVMKNGLAGQGGGWGDGSGSTDSNKIAEYHQNVDDVIHYLKNRVQFKGLLNVSLGGGVLGKYNPWNMAEGVMPSNQLAQANNDYISWLERALQSPSNTTVLANYKNEIIGSSLVQVFDGNNPTDYIVDLEDGSVWSKAKLDTIPGKTAYKRDIIGKATFNGLVNGSPRYTYASITFGDPASIMAYGGPNYDYPVQEGKVAKDDAKWQFVKKIQELIETSKHGTQDEIIRKARDFDAIIVNSPTFSSGPIDSYVEFVSNAIKDGVYPYSIYYNQVVMDPKDETYTSIRGKLTRKNIVGDTELLDMNIKGIYKDTKYVSVGANNMKALVDYNYKPGDAIPVLVNRFTSKFYNLKIGQRFEMHIDNKADRHLYHDQSSMNTFQVVGEVDAYSNVELFTLKDIANKVLKLDAVNGFNGIFSNSKAPTALMNVNIYSESGIYTPFDTVPQDQGNESHQLLSTWLTTSHNSLPAYHDGKQEAIDNIDKFITRYTKSIYTSIVSDVQWSSMTHYAFVSVNGITSDIIALGEAVALFIAMVFIIILGSMMVDANRINIATMKVMGYRDSEIRNSFIKSFLPTILIGAIIAIPFVFGLLAAAQLSIMAFGKVLIPMSMLGWEIVAATALTAGIFLTIFIGSIRKLKGQSALAAFSAAE